jgi:hypothetical protein
LRRFLTPVDEVHPAPANPVSTRYLRSYLVMRTGIGVLGIVLPFALVIVDHLWLGGDELALTSLSAYYYSGAREVFVGALCAIGAFLITYKVAEINLDNTLSLLAGLAVVVVALCPTERTDVSVAQTALQERLGEGVVGAIHFSAAGAFILALAVLSYYFGKREGARAARPGKRSPRFWKTYHWVCAGAIVVALLWCAVTAISGWGPSRALLYGEAAAVWAFAASWLMKGLELDLLRGGPPWAEMPS